MSEYRIPNFYNALESLGIVGWRISGQKDPSNEDEFNDQFQKEMSVTDGKLVFSSNPSDFGVTWSQIQTALDTLESEWEAKEYGRNRRDEYPDWQTQLEKIYDDGLTKWKSEMIDSVKTKWPKDNSGPV